jgi:hypothetical protein
VPANAERVESADIEKWSGVHVVNCALSSACSNLFFMGLPPRPELPLPATTTVQQDLTTAGQRRINLIWEHTQAMIALLVVVAAMAGGLWEEVKESKTQIPTILSTAFGTVVGFYFGRTNHTRTGGIGPNETNR